MSEGDTEAPRGSDWRRLETTTVGQVDLPVATLWKSDKEEVTLRKNLL